MLINFKIKGYKSNTISFIGAKMKFTLIKTREQATNVQNKPRQTAYIVRYRFMYKPPIYIYIYREREREREREDEEKRKRTIRKLIQKVIFFAKKSI
jgi:hypothetical protein